MTPHELAEKIWCSGAPYFGARDKGREVERIESLLTEALAEATIGLVDHKTMMSQINASVKACYEECAKIAEATKPIAPDYDTVSNATSCLKYNIALAIRRAGGLK